MFLPAEKGIHFAELWDDAGPGEPRNAGEGSSSVGVGGEGQKFCRVAANKKQ